MDRVLARRRGEVDLADRTVHVPHLRGSHLRPTVLYPTDSGATASWDPADGTLTVTLPRPGTAVPVRLGDAPAPERP